MVRLLIIFIIFLLLYFGFSLLSQLDSILTIELYDYCIESSFFTFIVTYLFSTIIGLLFFKTIFLIFNLPSYVKYFIGVKKANKTNYQLMKATAEFIIGEKSKSQNSLKKIKDTLKDDSKLFSTLLLAEIEEDQEQKIKYFQELEQFKLYTIFATKRLAQIFYQNALYKEAETYAIKSFYLNEHDGDNLEILMDCYAKLFDWEKLTFIMSKLNRVDKQRFQSIKNKLANYYIFAANNMLEVDNPPKAIYYLEIALELIPSNYEALNLYFTLNYSHKKEIDITFLKNAFIENPSIQVAELYQKFSSLSPIQIYEELETLIDSKHHLELFLTLAAYLNLPEKITQLKTIVD